MEEASKTQWPFTTACILLKHMQMYKTLDWLSFKPMW